MDYNIFMFINNYDFDETIEKEWASPVMYDGITNIEHYKKSKPKILWILKESNENGKKENRDHREFHVDVTVYPYWKRTYKKSILTTYGIIHTKSYDDMLDFSYDKTLKGNYKILNDVAFINVNKTGGKAQSQDWYISECYQKHKETLLTQIDEIAPDVIINCSRIGEVFDDLVDRYSLLKEKKIADGWPINFAFNEEKLIIDYWHPNSRIKNDWYCTQIITIYQDWEE